MRRALVTGCSSGFGRLLVPALLAEGWEVWAGLRGSVARAGLFDAERARHGERLRLLELDVASGADRAAIAAALRATGGGLDLLVNNAGSGCFGALEDVDEAQLRAQFEVNFFGLALLTRECLPALRAARGRVINLSSLLGVAAMPLSAVYSASKFAVEGLTEGLYHELAPHGVRVALIEPGAFDTGFMGNAGWAARADAPESPYRTQSRNYLALRAQVTARASGHPDAVVRAILRVARAGDPPLRTFVGRDARAMRLLQRLLPDRLFQRATRFLYTKLFTRGSSPVAELGPVPRTPDA